MRKAAVLGATAAALILAGCSAAEGTPAPTPTVTVTATPQPTVTVTATPESEQSPADADPVGSPMAPAAFAVSARGDLREMLKDVDDARVALDDGGTFRLLGNAAELAFNLGQLQAIDPPAAVADAWTRALTDLDQAVTDFTDALTGDSVSAISKALSTVEATAERLIAIAESAAP